MAGHPNSSFVQLSGFSRDRPAPVRDDRSIKLVRSAPILLLHLSPLFVLAVGWSWTAAVVAFGLYVTRMFTITGFYHRYFSHRSFRTSRAAQFLFAALGSTATQRGALWWAGHHRYHHRHADTANDPHSPVQDGFFRSHLGWLLTDASRPTRWGLVRDFAIFPELRLLDRYYMVVPALLCGALLAVGSLLENHAPQLGTDGAQLLVWGYCVSTFLLLQGTYSINSLAHRFGTRRFPTRDHSRNNWWLALITLGEGWHNNHHRYPSSARQGLRWWEIDVTWYGLLALQKIGLIWDLKRPPEEKS